MTNPVYSSSNVYDNSRNNVHDDVLEANAIQTLSALLLQRDENKSREAAQGPNVTINASAITLKDMDFYIGAGPDGQIQLYLKKDGETEFIGTIKK